MLLLQWREGCGRGSGGKRQECLHDRLIACSCPPSKPSSFLPPRLEHEQVYSQVSRRCGLPQLDVFGWDDRHTGKRLPWYFSSHPQSSLTLLSSAPDTRAEGFSSATSRSYLRQTLDKHCSLAAHHLIESIGSPYKYLGVWTRRCNLQMIPKLETGKNHGWFEHAFNTIPQ